MKSKNSKLMYVSAAVLAAGAVAGVNTQNAHAAEVQKQADKNAAQKTIDQNQKDLTHIRTNRKLSKQQKARSQSRQTMPHRLHSKYLPKKHRKHRCLFP